MVCLEFSRPVSSWFRVLYDFYSFTFMPMIGKILTNSPQAYVYLPESIRLFPLQEDLARLLRDIGFRDVSYQNLTNGIAVIHLGRKE